MTTLDHPLPCLGASATACTHVLGRPLRVERRLGAEFQQYLVAGQLLTGCLYQGVLVAVHIAYDPRFWPLGPAGLQPRDFQPEEHPEPLRVCVEDAGWAVATQTCPYALIRALMATA